MNNFTKTKQILSLLLRKRILFMMLMLGAMSSMGQLAMTRTTFTGAYATISGTPAATAQADNGNFAATIPFTFNYLGVGYTACNINSNGYINFGTATATNTNSTLFTTTAPQGTVAPWFDDMFPTSVQFTTTGTTPNQVFTVQWVGPSYWSGATRTVSYQVKLYETSNIIEFWYDTPSGAFSLASIAESASIGIENLTGGPGNFIDAVSGSSQIGNGTLNSGQWPTVNYRFTPGTPTAIAAGTYNVGVAQTYTTLTEAVADINHRGISGAVVLNLTDATYTDKTAGGAETFPIVFATVTGSSAVNTLTITGNGADLRYAGSVAGAWNNGSASGTMFATTAEPILGVCGTDFLTVNNIKLTALTAVVYGTGTGTPTRVDRGLAVQNSGAINGSTNNNFNNITITLDRTNTNTMAIDQGTSTAPTSTAGANSTNIYRDLIIKNAQKGISLGGNATFPDIGCEIGTAICTNFNTIGDPTVANDIGNAGVASFGIQASNQQDVKIYNNSVRNITTTGAFAADGINMVTFQGTCSVYNNKIQTIRNASISATTGLSGIKASHTTTGTHTLRIYNNAVSEILSSYTGAASATRTLKGIFVASSGGGTATQSYQVYNNSVSIDGSASLNTSSICFETGTSSGPVYNLANNIFANFTATQGAPARHSCIYSPSATALGPTGTSSNNNNFFVANDVGTSGFMGIGNTTTYSVTALWAAAMVSPAGMEAASVALNPLFVSNTSDLHIAAGGLNGAGQAPPGYVTVDLDCATRTPDNDIGAYKIDGCTAAVGGTASFTGSASACVGSTKSMSSTGASPASAGLSYQWEVSLTGGGAGFANVVGGTGATTTSYTTGALTAGTYFYRLNVTCSNGPVTGFSNEISLTVNAAPTVTVSPTLATICQPGGTPITLTAGGAVTYAWSPTSDLTPTSGSPVSANPGGTTTYTVTGTDANGCTNTTTSVITVASAISSVASATPATVCSGTNSQLNVATTALLGVIKITEVTLFRTGTGTTSPYPAFVVGADLVEISNISSSPVDISGWTLADYASASATVSHAGFAFPASTIIPANSVAVVCLGTGTNDLVNRYFNTGGTSDLWGSGSLMGVVLKNGATVVDAVGLNSGYVFNAGTGVTAGDWSGFAPSASTFAGTIRSAASDNNTGADWIQSSAVTPQTQGTYNVGYTNPTGPLTYLWSPTTFIASGDELIQNPVATAVTASTTYSVTVTTTNGCSASSNVTVDVTPLGCSAATITGSLCSNSNFTVTANHSGGGAPYSYAWSDGSATTYPNSASVTANFPTGTYTLTCTVSDACGASCVSSVVVNVNALSTVSISPSSGLICNPGGSAITLTASGAVSYVWLPTSGLTPSTGSIVSANPVATTTYIVAGTDANGCVTTGVSVITVADALSNVTASATPNPLCEGSTLNLSSSISISAPSTYSFAGSSNPPYTSITGTTLGAGSIGDDMAIGNLPIGFTFNYNGIPQTVFAAASNGFIELGSVSTYTNNASSGWTPSSNLLSGRANIIAPLWEDNNTTGGSIIYATTGSVGSRVLTVQWTGMHVGSSGSATQPTIDMQLRLYEGSNNIEFIYGSTSAALTSTTASIGLSGNVGNFLSVTPLSPVNTSTKSSLTENTSISSATNFPNGTVYTFTPPTLSYAWSGPNTYSSSSQNPSITSIPVANSGTYTVTATSAAGCTATSITSAVVVNPIPGATISGTTSICSGGSAVLTLNLGGTGPWLYEINGVLASSTVSTFTVSVSPSSTTTYSLAAFADNNCDGTFSGSANITVNEPSIAPTNITGTSTICEGQNTTLSLSGGTAGTGANAEWFTGSCGGTSAGTGASINVSPTTTTTYFVRYNGTCNTTSCASITVTVNLLPTASISGPASVCAGSSATLTVNLTGTGPWSYSINGGATATSSVSTFTLSVSPSIATTYSVSAISDANCTGVASSGVTVAVNALPTPSITGNQILCNGGSTVLDAGSFASYNWSTGASTQTISVSTAGTYSVNVTNAFGCSASASFTVNPIPAAIVVSANHPPILTLGGSTTVTVSATGGSGSYTSGTGVFAGVVAGTYTYTVTDNNGCTGSTAITITQPGAVIVTATPGTILCNGGTTSVVVTATGGSGTYVSGLGTFTNRSAGTHTFTVTDNAGVSGSAVITITQPTAIVVTATPGIIACNGETTSVVVTATGGTGAYTGTGTFTNRSAGINSFTVTDANNCPSSAVINISQPSAIVMNVAAGTIACNGGTTSYTVTASGGTGSLSGTGVFTNISSGTYTIIVSDANSCTKSSVITIAQPTAITVNATAGAIICNGGTTTVNVSASGGTGTITGTGNFTNVAAGTYTYTVTDANGCTKSAVTTITQPAALPPVSNSIVRCNSYLWPITGQTYTNTGTYSQTVLNGSGCVFTQVLNLTINYSSPTTSFTATACDSYLWTGTTYTVSGNYTKTFTNASGCDSIRTLQLTVNQSTSNTTIAAACDNYIWGYNGTTYTISGTYTVTSTNPAGCVHSEILVLTITPTTTASSSITSCGAYTWYSNTYTASGTYTRTTGCHIETLILTINSVNSFSTTLSAGACYVWPINGASYTVSGMYTYTLTNPSTGCLETHNLNLTILPGVTVATKVLLGGPYVGAGLMHDSLRVKGMIPTTPSEPIPSYVLAVTGPNAIVDWVTLELRDMSNSALIVATKRALVQRDGDIVSNLDGISPVFFSGMSETSYYISVKHRNHLGVMTLNPVALYACPSGMINFSDLNPVYTKPFASLPQRKQIGSVNVLWSGDANSNKNVRYNGSPNDKDAVLIAVTGFGGLTSSLPGYRLEDVNMDGNTKYNGLDNDRSVILNNVGVSTPNAVINQHTPN